jgi:alpha-L-arabinofuranosidase
VTASIRIGSQPPASGRVFEIAEDPSVEVSYLNAADVMKTVEKPFAATGQWEFPAASVSALELTIGSAGGGEDQ